jgi:hypothetical protein
MWVATAYPGSYHQRQLSSGEIGEWIDIKPISLCVRKIMGMGKVIQRKNVENEKD